MAGDAAEIIEGIGKPVTFRGTTQNMSVSTADIQQLWTDGGQTYKAGFIVHFFVPPDSPLIGNLPTQGEQIYIQGIKCTITSVTPRFPDPWFDAYAQDTSTV